MSSRMKAGVMGVWLLVAMAPAADGEPLIVVEGGLAVARSTGTLTHAPTSESPEVTIGVTVAPYLSVTLTYRSNLIDGYTIHLPATGLNSAPLTYHYSDVALAVRYARPVLPNVLVFGEAQLVGGSTTTSDQDFAGGDDLVDGNLGVGLRAGVIGQLPGTPLGAGLAVSYQHMQTSHPNCLVDNPCVESWHSLDLFARITF